MSSTDQARAWANEGSRRARKAVEDVEETVSDAAQRARTRARRTADDLSGRGDEVLESLEQRVLSYPLASLGIAFLLGYLVSLLFHRR